MCFWYAGNNNITREQHHTKLYKSYDATYDLEEGNRDTETLIEDSLSIVGHQEDVVLPNTENIAQCFV